MSLNRHQHTFRLFVSSTFEDLKQERRALHRWVFPRLRDLCESSGCRFQPIDLRWSIREEAGLDHQTLKVCLDEVRRCARSTRRPNFLALMGQRYGWRPLPSEISTARFELLIAACDAHSDGAGLRLLRDWYLFDANIAPGPGNEGGGGYHLRRRTAPWIEHHRWANEIESPLRAVFDRLSGVAPLLSATEQEILEGILRAEGAPLAAFAVCRTITNVSAGDLPEPFVERTKDGALDEFAQRQVTDLRGRLADHLGGDFWICPAQWSGTDVTPDHIGSLPESLAQCEALPVDSPLLETLCGKVWSRLSGIIRREIDEFAGRAPVAFDRDVHNTIEHQQADAVHGREEDRRDIIAALIGNEIRSVAVIAPSGMGKTALLARIAQDLRARFPSARVLSRFAGATPGSTRLRDLLEDVTEDLQGVYGLALPRSRSITELANQLRALLEQATTERPLFLLIDGLDELAAGDRAHDLIWLPTRPPPNAHILVSALPGRCADAAARLLPAAKILKVSPMSLEEGRQLLDRLLAELGRRLTPGQRSKVLDGFAVERSPLYLRLAVARAVSWRSYFSDDLTQLPATVADLTRLVLDDLASPAWHGPVVLKRTLAYLLASRFGLSDDELGNLLSEDDDVRRDFEGQSRHEFTDRNLPPVVLTRVLSDLRPFLREDPGPSSTTLAFRHGQVAVVAAGAAGETITTRTAHRVLGDFFRKRYEAKKALSRTSDLSREAIELPYQLREARAEWAEVKGLLCDIDFVIDKCGAGLVRDLLADFESSEGVLIPRAEDLDDEWRGWEQFVRLESDNLAAAGNPGAALVLQQAFNTAVKGAVPEAAERRLSSAIDLDGEWIARLNRPPRATPRGVLRLHHRQVKHLTVIDSHRALSVSPDHAIEIWDLDTGETLVQTARHATAIVHLQIIGADRVVSASDDGEVSIWRIDSGERVGRWAAGLQRPVIAADAHRLVMAARSGDGFRIVTLNPQTGEIEDTSETIFGMPRVVARTVGQTAVGTYGGAVHLIEPGRAALTIAPERVSGSWKVTFLADHAFIYPDRKVRQDKNVKDIIQVWDLRSREIAYEIEIQDASPEQLLSIENPDEFCLAWADRVEIRRLRDGSLLRKAPAGGRKVSVIGMEQHHLVLHAEPGALLLWRPDEDAAPRVFQHERLSSAAVVTNDRLLVASSKVGELLSWDVATGALIGAAPAGLSRPPQLASISTDRFLAYDDGIVGVWGFDELRGTSGAGENRLAGRDPAIVARDLGVVIDGTRAQLWNLDTGQMRLLAEHKGKIKSVVRISDKAMATVGADCRVILWDLVDARSRGEINGDGIEFRHVVALGRGAIAIVREDGACALWDAATAKRIAELTDDQDSISRIAMFAPSDVMIVAAHQSGSLTIFDSSTGEPRHRIRRPPSTVTELITLDDMVLLKSYQGDLMECAIELLVNPTSPRLVLIEPDGETMGQQAVQGELLITAGRRRGVRAWNLEKRECIWTVTADMVSADPRTIPRFRLIPGDKCAIAHGDSVSIWDLHSGRHLENSTETLGMLAEGVTATREGLLWGSTPYPLNGYPAFASSGAVRVLLTEQDDGVVHVLERRRIEAPSEPMTPDKDSPPMRRRQLQGLRVEPLVTSHLPTTIHDRIVSATTVGVVMLALSALGAYGLARGGLGLFWTGLAGISLLFVSLLGIGMIRLGHNRRARLYWMGEGAVRRAGGDLDGALEAFERCRSLAKGEPGALALSGYEAAGVLDDLGRFPEAMARLQSAEPFFESHGRFGQMHERCLMGLWLVSRKLGVEYPRDAAILQERLRVLALLEECYRHNRQKILLQGTQAERYIILASTGRHTDALEVALAFQRDHPEEYANRAAGGPDPLLDWASRMGYVMDSNTTGAQMSAVFDDNLVDGFRKTIRVAVPETDPLRLDAQLAEKFMAAESYDRALEQFKDVADRAGAAGKEKIEVPAIANQAIALIRLGRPGEAEPLFLQAEARYRAAADYESLRILLKLKTEEIIRSAGDLNLAMATAVSLAELEASHGDLDGWTRAVWVVHTTAVAGADSASEMARIETLAEEAGRRQAATIRAVLFQCRAVLLENQNASPEQRRQAFEDVERAAVDQPDIQAAARANLAMLTIGEVELSETLHTLKELRRDFLRTDHLEQAEVVQGNIRLIEGKIGEEADRFDRLAERAASQSDWTEALDHVEASAALLQELDRPRQLAEALGVRGFILKQLGRQDEADESIAEAVSVAEKHQLPDVAEQLKNWREGDST